MPSKKKKLSVVASTTPPQPIDLDTATNCHHSINNS